jgi:hypothetical protein
VRVIERVAREDFPSHLKRERDDEPRERLADEGADFVDEKQ